MDGGVKMFHGMRMEAMGAGEGGVEGRLRRDIYQSDQMHP